MPFYFLPSSSELCHEREEAIEESSSESTLSACGEASSVKEVEVSS